MQGTDANIGPRWRSLVDKIRWVIGNIKYFKARSKLM